MTEKNAQLEAGLASDLNRELGMACVGCISESKNELRCYDCKVTSSGKGSNFLAVESIVKPKPLKLRQLDAAMRFLGINSDND